MEKKEKVKQVFKYIFLGLGLTTYGFIFYHSAIVPKASDKWNSWAKDLWTGLINDALGIKEDTSLVKPEEVTLNHSRFISEDSTESSEIPGYKENEIPLGGEKWLEAVISPRTTTNKSMSFVASNDKVKLVQTGAHIDIEAMELCEVTIKAICNADNSVNAEYTYSIVEPKAPEDINFFVDYLDVGKSQYLFSEVKDASMHYYDFSKLTITSSNESVAVIRGEYVKAIAPGKTTITVSNGERSETQELEVKANASSLSNVTGLNVKGEDTVLVRQINYNESVQLEAEFQTDTGNQPTDSGVIWSVDNPLAAYVSQDGRVWGNKYLSDDDVSFTVRATSVDNPLIYKDYNMTLSHITPTNIVLNPSMAFDQGYYIADNSKSKFIGVQFDVPYITKFNYEVVVSDPSVIKAEVVGSGIIVVGLKEGNSKLYIVSKDNPNLKSDEINIQVRTRGYINDDNSEDFSKLVRKYLGGHAFLFMVASIFLTLYVFIAHIDKKRLFRLLAVCSALLIGFLMGMISEGIEGLVPGRVPAWSDVFIDLSGTAVGFVLVFIYIGIRELVLYKRSKKVSEEVGNS